MRFKNLTITLTLTCLSIVALAGLVLLPISNGACQLTVKDWKYSEDNTSAYYGAYHDDENWSLTSWIDAKGINAGVSVNAWPALSWTETKTKEGTGIVYAHKGGYNFEHEYPDLSLDPSDENYCNNWQGYLLGGCGGHERDPETNTNDPNSDHFNEQPDDLILKVDVTTVTRVDITAQSNSSSDTFDLTVGAGDDRAKVGFGWQHGTVMVTTITVRESYPVTIAKAAIERGVEVNLVFDEYAFSSASSFFDFDDNEVDDCGYVFYHPPDPEDDD